MNLSDVKEYLIKRINSGELLSLVDCELEKYLFTSYTLLETFYYIEDIKDDDDLAKVVGEEMIFLFNSDIDLNLFYRYEGLTSFKIGDSAIQGTVDYSNKGSLFSPIVRSILDSLGIEEKIQSYDAHVKSGFTWL